jgi:hypothetical protein
MLREGTMKYEQRRRRNKKVRKIDDLTEKRDKIVLACYRRQAKD